MKFYGNGTLKDSSGKVVYDFVDGPLDTDDPGLAEIARSAGLSAGEQPQDKNDQAPKRGRPRA